MHPTIVCKFSCALCGVHQHNVAVPARVDDTDVKVWMDATVLLVAKEHKRLSPTCQARELTNLMIPMPKGADRIGGVARN